MPETAQQTLMQIEQRGHPWRGTQLTRTSWIEEMAAEGIEVPMFDGTQEYLYWVGCSGALQERNVKVTKSLVRLLMQAGVSFGVLGLEEGCSGDPARRLGNEYLYQTQAEHEHRGVQGEERPEGHRQLPALLQHDRARVPAVQRHVRGHPPLRLPRPARRRGQDPRRRRATASARRPSPTTTPATSRATTTSSTSRAASSPPPAPARSRWAAARSGTFCCGAGGSHMWVEENRGERINVVRAQEAVDTGADVIAVACPFCMQMFESGVGSVPGADERGVQVFDLAELLDQSVAYSRPSGNGGTPMDPRGGSGTATGLGDARSGGGQGGGGGDADGSCRARASRVQSHIQGRRFRIPKGPEFFFGRASRSPGSPLYRGTGCSTTPIPATPPNPPPPTCPCPSCPPTAT